MGSISNFKHSLSLRVLFVLTQTYQIEDVSHYHKQQTVHEYSTVGVRVKNRGENKGQANDSKLQAGNVHPGVIQFLKPQNQKTAIRPEAPNCGLILIVVMLFQRGKSVCRIR